MRMNKNDAVEEVQPYLHLFSQCIQHGWDTWKTQYAHRHHVLDARARAAIVYDEITTEAKRVFGELHNVVLRIRYGSLMVYVGDNVVVRFKKLRRTGRANNIMTKNQMNLYRQIPIPGYLPGTHLNAGYVLDDLQQQIDRLLVTCQDGKRVMWTFDLDQASGRTTSAVVPMPTPASPAPKRRVQPKRDKEAKEDSGSRTDG